MHSFVIDMLSRGQEDIPILERNEKGWRGSYHDGDDICNLASQLKDNDGDWDSVSDGGTEGSSAHHSIGSCRWKRKGVSGQVDISHNTEITEQEYNFCRFKYVQWK